MKSTLQAMQPTAVREPLDGLHGAAVATDRKRNAGWHRLAVEEHGAGAALAAVTAGLGSRETDGLAQVVNEQLILGDRVLAPAPIEPQAQDALAEDGLPDFAHVFFLTTWPKFVYTMPMRYYST